MLPMLLTSKDALFAMNSADIEVKRGVSSTASFANAQAVLASCCAQNYPICGMATVDIAKKVSLLITPAPYSVPHKTLCAEPGFGKARKSHRANAQAVLEMFSGSNCPILLMASCASAAISSGSLTQSVEQAHAMPAMLEGTNCERFVRAEADIAAISSSSWTPSFAKDHAMQVRSDGLNYRSFRIEEAARELRRGVSNLSS